MGPAHKSVKAVKRLYATLTFVWLFSSRIATHAQFFFLVSVTKLYKKNDGTRRVFVRSVEFNHSSLSQDTKNKKTEMSACPRCDPTFCTYDDTHELIVPAHQSRGILGVPQKLCEGSHTMARDKRKTEEKTHDIGCFMSFLQSSNMASWFFILQFFCLVCLQKDGNSGVAGWFGEPLLESGIGCVF